MSYKFKDLLALAFNEWPLIIDVSELTFYGLESDIYQVKSLDLIADDIQESYIGKYNEVIFRNLHIAIAHTIYLAAKHISSINIKDLRDEVIRYYFEEKLLAAANESDLGYLESDIELIKKYFDNNQ